MIPAAQDLAPGGSGPKGVQPTLTMAAFAIRICADTNG
jgi:hypothetical protein